MSKLKSVKSRLSESATKFEKIAHIDLTFTFVSLSEYIDFNSKNPLLVLGGKVLKNHTLKPFVAQIFV